MSMPKYRYSLHLRLGDEIVGYMVYKTTEADIEKVADTVYASIREPLYAAAAPRYDRLVVLHGVRHAVRANEA